MKSLSRSQLIDRYWRSHPRFMFFKGVRPNARVLDLGAGGGGMPFWREYLEPSRRDIRMFGSDLAKPPTHVLYEQFATTDLNDAFPFDLQFDAIVGSHILEHVRDPGALVRQIASHLAPGGQAFIELPAPHTKTFPSAEVYRGRGWPMMISNFHDDATHLDTLSLDELVSLASTPATTVIQSGYVSVPFVEHGMIARGIEESDSELLLYGFWSKTRWAQYVVMERSAGR